jgi:hypothetical protein
LITVLLQMLLPELEDPVSGEELPNATDGSQSTKSREKITAIMRRILPALRQYSTWLVSRSFAISKAARNPELFSHIHKMWSLYAQVQRKIASVFAIDDLDASIVKYLLGEDEMTIGFKPLRDPDIPDDSNLYTDQPGILKPRLTDPGIERSPPNVEMKGRIRDILICALVMYSKNLAPLTLDNGQFKFVEERLQYSSPIPAQQPPAQQSNSTISSPAHSDRITAPAVISEESKMINQGYCAAPFDAHGSFEQSMSRMVDNLVEGSRSASRSATNETSYGMHSNTANEIFAPTGSSGSSAAMQSTQKMLPSLPGIMQSPFTPQPHELQSSSPNRLSSGRQLSPLQLSTAEQQLAAARAFDKMTGVDGSRYNSWGRTSSRPTSATTSQPIHQLQEALAQQFMPMTQGSSMFSDSSSIYANTPRAENRLSGGLRSNLYLNGNNTTMYAGASDFERQTMLQSSLWDDGQPLRDGGYMQTPPGGQGG